RRSALRRFASLKSTFDKSASLRFAPQSLAPVKLEFFRWAPCRGASTRSGSIVPWLARHSFQLSTPVSNIRRCSSFAITPAILPGTRNRYPSITDIFEIQAPLLNPLYLFFSLAVVLDHFLRDIFLVTQR